MAVDRREIMISAAPDDVWAAIGDPAALSTWFPGIVSAEVNGSSRVVTTASGLRLPEEIVTNDPVRRVFAYRLTAPLIRDHLGTIEVRDAGFGQVLVRYETRCEPDSIALMIGGACGSALRELRRQLESSSPLASASPGGATPGGASPGSTSPASARGAA